MSVFVEIVWQAGADRTLGLPSYVTAGAAGADLKAHLPDDERKHGKVLHPGARARIATGIGVHIPPDFEAQIRPRSGLAWRHGVTILNAPGTIDSDYRGEIAVLLVNLGAFSYTIEHGCRIAQMVIAPIVRVFFKSTDNLPDSSRGRQGFGSTGV